MIWLLRKIKKAAKRRGDNLVASEARSGASTKLNAAQPAQKSKIFGMPEIQWISKHIKWVSICAGPACQLSKKLCVSAQQNLASEASSVGLLLGNARPACQLSKKLFASESECEGLFRGFRSKTRNRLSVSTDETVGEV